jgi:hypothetical protein
MRTKKIIALSLLLSLVFFGCVKHEVIPPPTPSVDLVPHFTGIINETDVEYTDDVDGFNAETSEAQYILPPPELSTVVYFCDMKSNLISTAVKVAVGGLQWDAGALDKPSLLQFNTFFTDRLTPVTLPFSLNGKSGFEVTYSDNFGNVWKSDETSVNAQSAVFTEIENDQDGTGDYSKFKLEFSCHVYRTIGLNERDSLRIENGIFEGWFKR